MAIGEGISLVAIRNQTRDRGEMLLTLHVANDRIAATDRACGKVEVRVALRTDFVPFRLDHADWDLSSVGHVDGGGNRIFGMSQVVNLNPIVDEDEDGGPRIRTYFRVA
jgi:hypothetical protein